MTETIKKVFHINNKPFPFGKEISAGICAECQLLLLKVLPFYLR